MSKRFQESIGTPIDPVTFSFSARLFGVTGTLVFIFLSFVAPAVLPLSPFRAGFFMDIIFYFAVLLFVILIKSWFDSKVDVVRYRLDSGFTWFSQVSFLNPLTTSLFALVPIAMGVYGTYFVVTGLIWNTGNLLTAVPRSAWVLSVAGVVLSVFAWREAYRAIRGRPGIRLSVDQVVVNYKNKNVFLPWKQVTGVTVEMVPKSAGRRKRFVPAVRIEADKGRVFHVEAFELGSDPNVVAAFILYYRDHLRDREALSDPEESIRRFREAQV